MSRAASQKRLAPSPAPHHGFAPVRMPAIVAALSAGRHRPRMTNVRELPAFLRNAPRES